MSIAQFAVVSYGIAFAGFLLLTLLLLTSWEGRAQGARLVVASGVTALWAAFLGFEAWAGGVPVQAVALADFLRDGAWLAVLTGLALPEGAWRTLARWSLGVAGAAILLAVGQLLVPAVAQALLEPPALLVAGGLVLSLLAMVLLEQIYRNANAAGRRALKYLIIGVGTLFAYDLFLYSQAQLLHGVEPASWAVRGVVAALVVPLIALAARSNPQWSLNVFVSRQVVFYSTSLLAVGAYLLVMAAGGYLILLYGGTWGRVMQLLFVAGAGMVLLVLLASAGLRRRLRVFLSKHFYRNKYDYRVEWLRFVDTLSRRDAGTDVRANAVRAIAQIIGSGGGVLYLPAADGQSYVPVSGWPGQDFPPARHAPVGRGDDLSAFLARRLWVADLQEWRRSPDLYDNAVLPAFLVQERTLRLIVPLVLGDDLYGFVMLAEPPPPFEITYEDRDLLKTAGRDVAMHLAQHEADRRLAESRQFEAYHRLTAFVMHDLKNLAAQLSLVVTNAEKHRRNPEFVDDAISTVAHSSTRMQRLIEQLQRRENQATLRRTDLVAAAREACRLTAMREPVPVLGAPEGEVWVMADPERLCTMVEHLVRNAQEATPTQGSVRILVRREPGVAATVSVIDTGSGMTEEFVSERLFRPFDTTKGSKGMGIGAYQVREFVQELGGRVEVQSAPDRGTTVTLWMPACN